MVIDDSTEDGVHIFAEITQDTTYIAVDGVVARVVDYRHYRDGGTRIFVTDLGTLKLPHKLRCPDHHPRWNGKDIGQPSQELLEWREQENARIRKAFINIYHRESGGR